MSVEAPPKQGNRAPGAAYPDTLRMVEFVRASSPGDEFTYEQLAAAGRISVEVAKQRLATVRRHLLNEGVALVTVRGLGVKHATSNDIVAKSSQDIVAVGRKARRIKDQGSCVKFAELSKDDQVRHCVTMSVAHQTAEQATAKSMRRLENQTRKSADTTDVLMGMMRRLTGGG